MKPEWMPPLPNPRKKPVYATSKNTASVRSGHEMGGYEKEPPLWDENQMHDYAIAAVEAYKQTPEARRDRAIAQAVEELERGERTEFSAHHKIMRRADELLEGKK